jgi:hypothetical protein
MRYVDCIHTQILHFQDPSSLSFNSFFVKIQKRAIPETSLWVLFLTIFQIWPKSNLLDSNVRRDQLTVYTPNRVNGTKLTQGIQTEGWAF